MERLIIGAPFGNHLNFPNATSTLGTFTSKYRGGFWKRLWRVLRTVRYYSRLKAFSNKLGLPNPGIDWLVRKATPRVIYTNVTDGGACTRHVTDINVRDKIISVMGFNLHEWHHVTLGALGCGPLAIEMNVSCPNCPGEDRSDYREVFRYVADLAGEVGIEVIVKLPPLGYMSLVRAACDAGIRSFHCCNTLPTPGGGLSGKPLQVFSLQAVQDVRNYCYARNYDLKTLIGGGGVTSWRDALLFWGAGATNVSVASACFFFWKWGTITKIAGGLKEMMPPQPGELSVKDITKV